MTVRLYVEGGGESETLHSRCREGFRGFLGRAGFRGCMPRVVACGGRRAAYDRFKMACESGEVAMLLIDSEECVSTSSPWEYLANRSEDKFTIPQNSSDGYCHLMVVCMESWFLADKEALASFFGQGFNPNALPQNTDIEAISKKDIFNGLQRATSHCQTKAPYGKGEHSFKILALISPDRVSNASPWAKRFLDKLQIIMNG